MLQLSNKVGWAYQPNNIKHGEKMQENTKKYMKELIDDLSIEANMPDLLSVYLLPFTVSAIKSPILLVPTSVWLSFAKISCVR
jgi:hypothetical protein